MKRVYQVTTDYFYAGFIVENGRVIQMAPILRKRFDYWKHKAKLVAQI